MSTAIAVYNSEGCVGRCDARCHEASKPDCDCICGGRLHGVGSSEAAVAANTEHFGGEAALSAWAARHNLTGEWLRVETSPPVLF